MPVRNPQRPWRAWQPARRPQRSPSRRKSQTWLAWPRAPARWLARAPVTPDGEGTGPTFEAKMLYLWANGSVGKNERPNFGASQWVTTLRVLAGRATHGQARGAVVPRVGRRPEAVDPGERVGEGVARRAALAELPIGGAAVPRLQALGVDDHHRAAQVEAGRHAEALDHDVEVDRRAARRLHERDERGDVQVQVLRAQVLALGQHRPDDHVGDGGATRAEHRREDGRVRHQPVERQQVDGGLQVGRQVLQLGARDRERHTLAARAPLRQVGVGRVAAVARPARSRGARVGALRRAAAVER
eukprot:scaffold78413_cov67-Phaeocystis_antarctica.AAC.4